MRILLIIVSLFGIVGAAAAESAPAGESDERVFVVTGVFRSMQSAIEQERRLEESFTGVHTETILVNGDLHNRIVIGPVPTSDVERLKLLLAAQGVEGAWTLPLDAVNVTTGIRDAGFVEPTPRANNVRPPPSTPSERADTMTPPEPRARYSVPTQMNKPADDTKPKKVRKEYNPAALRLPERDQDSD